MLSVTKGKHLLLPAASETSVRRLLQTRGRTFKKPSKNHHSRIFFPEVEDSCSITASPFGRSELSMCSLQLRSEESRCILLFTVPTVPPGAAHRQEVRKYSMSALYNVLYFYLSTTTGGWRCRYIKLSPVVCECDRSYYITQLYNMNHRARRRSARLKREIVLHTGGRWKHTWQPNNTHDGFNKQAVKGRTTGSQVNRRRSVLSLSRASEFV